MSIIQIQCNFQKTEDSDIATNTCESSKDSDGGDRSNVKGVVIIVVFQEDTHVPILKLAIVGVHIVGHTRGKLEIVKSVILHGGDAKLPQV